MTGWRHWDGLWIQILELKVVLHVCLDVVLLGFFRRIRFIMSWKFPSYSSHQIDPIIQTVKSLYIKP